MTIINKINAARYNFMYKTLIAVNKNNALTNAYKEEGFKLLADKVDKLPEDIAFRSQYISKRSMCVKAYDKFLVFVSKANLRKPIEERFDALIHEIGHWLHFQQMPPKAERQQIWQCADKEKIREVLSEQAIQGDDGLEFVAEMFKGLVKGNKYDGDLTYLYYLLNGPMIK